jgi:hypothetical protein
MKSIAIGLFSLLGFAGCVSVQLPPEAANVKLVPVSSVAVEIHRPKFRLKDGELNLEAYTFRQPEAKTTEDTHIDIVYLDASGRQLSSKQTDFTPSNLPRNVRPPRAHGYFTIPAKIPIDTAVIEVRAHEGKHPL